MLGQERPPWSFCLVNNGCQVSSNNLCMSLIPHRNPSVESVTNLPHSECTQPKHKHKHNSGKNARARIGRPITDVTSTD